jgi:hypothetical protein
MADTTFSSGTVIASTWLNQINDHIFDQYPTAAIVSAVGDGTTDDTAAFTTLEVTYKAKHVDLLGKVYLVTAIPTGNDYFNGAFKVGTEIFWKNQNPRSHPFEGPSTSNRAVLPQEGVYRGLNDAIFPVSGSSDWVLVWREAIGHSTINGSRLMCGDTDDAGHTVTGIRTVYTISTSDIRNFASGMMGSGRMGIIASRPKEDNSYLEPIFIYSDDNGVTWGTVELTATDTVDFHSKIYPYVAGGASAYIAYGYRPTADGGGITAWVTEDNGATWTENLNVVPVTASFPSISELSVTRIGTASQWVMAVRTSTGLNMGVATSTDQLTWTTLADSGLFLTSNPPELFYEDGKLWVLTFSRRGRPIIDEYGNAIVIAEGNAATVYSSGGTSGWSGWKVITATTVWPTGYISVEKIRDRYYGLWTMAEDTPGSSTGRTAYLGIISTDAPESASPRQIQAVIPQQNSVFNGGLQVWQAGTSFTSFSARNPVADGFTFSRGSFVAGATVSRITGENTQFAMRVRRDDSNSGTETMNLVYTLSLANSIPYRNRPVCLSFRARKASGFSAVDSFLTVQVRQTNNAAEQQITTSSGLFTTGDTAVESSNTGVTLTTSWEDYVLIINNIASDTTQISLRFTWTPVGTATNDYFDIAKIKMEPGQLNTPFVFPLEGEVYAIAQRFYQTKVVQTENGSRHIPLYKMHGTPTVTASAGTAGSITTDGFELSHTSATASTIVARYLL